MKVGQSIVSKFMLGAKPAARVMLGSLEVWRTTALPDLWLNMDIGAVGIKGQVSYENDVFTAIGAGAGLYATADNFHFAYQHSVRDCEIRARVETLNPPFTSAKSGVMIRESLDPSSRCAGVYVTPNSGVQFFRRTSPGSMVAVTTLAGISAPCWLRLRRTENRFYAYYSLDDTIWMQIGSHANVSMGAGSYIGLAITSGSAADTTNSSITGVDFTP